MRGKRKTRARSMLDFFKLRAGNGWRGGKRVPPPGFGGLSPEDVLRLVREISAETAAVEELVRFVKGHRRVARELTVEDVREVAALLAVREVMES